MEYLNYEVGKGLAILRKEKGISQKEVYLGLCDRSVYRKIETGESKNTSFLLILSFCSRLGISVDVLVKYSTPEVLKKYTTWIDYADKAIVKSSVDALTTNLPIFDKNELMYIKNELPTKEYQKFSILYFMSHFISDNSTYEKEDIIMHLETALHLTYNNSSKLLTGVEVSLVNNLLNVTNLSITYFKLALKFKEMLLLDGHDINDRSILLINNAIAFYYYYKRDWNNLFEHSTHFIKNYGSVSSYVLLHPFKYFIGISMYNLGREDDGIKRIRATILSIKITEQAEEYNNFQQMIINDNLKLSWFDNIDYQSILMNYNK